MDCSTEAMKVLLDYVGRSVVRWSLILTYNIMLLYVIMLILTYNIMLTALAVCYNVQHNVN